MKAGLTEEDRSMLESILKKNGPSDAVPVLCKQVIEGSGTPAFESAVAAIRKILEAGDDYDKRIEALIEPLTLGLEDPDPQTRKHASSALSLIRNTNRPPSRTIVALGECLKQWEPFPEVAHNAASALWGFALKGHDIGLAIEAIGIALKSTDHWTREAASEALSEYYRRMGAELLMRPDYHVLPDPILPGGRWELAVKYRRTHAMADDPVDKLCPSFQCAACRGDQTICVWYEEVLGTCFTFVTAEVLCKVCGKYSVYEYED